MMFPALTVVTDDHMSFKKTDKRHVFNLKLL